MKIAMIGHKRIPGREGGIEVVVEELVERMTKKGNDVIVYNRKKRGVKKIKEYKGAKIVTVPTIEKKSTDAIIYSFLASIFVLFSKADVIHYHGIGPSVMIFIPHFFKKRIIVTVHGLNYKTPKWKGLGAKVMLLGEKMTAKYADEIIVLSKEQKEYFKTKYNRETKYIPNGVSINTILEPNIIKEKWGLKKNSYILFLSRVVPGKGLEYLIDAYNEIHTDLPLIIAGSSDYADDFNSLIRKKIGNNSNIKMIGFVSGETLQELYSNAKVFVFPSEAEGMPMCLLEAMSYNTKCIVSDIPENIEVLGDLGINFKSKNTKDLKEKLELFLDSNDDKCNTRKHIIDNYNWDDIVEKTLKLYKNEEE